MKFSYYKHQQRVIDKDPDKLLLAHDTGTGKTITALSLAEKRILPTLVICPKAVSFKWNGEVKDFKENFFDNGTKYEVITKETFRRDWDKLPFYQTLIVDECFTRDTEILTNEGFKKFDKLNKNERVAQWDNGDISFVKPLRYIEREHDGEMISFKVKEGVDVLMTPNHEQLLINQKTGDVVKKPISQCNFHSLWRLPVSGKSIEKNDSLSPLERMYIATQADGSIHNITKRHVTVAFSFSKQRKIDRLKELVSETGLEMTSVKHSSRNVSRYMVKMPLKTTKDIRNHIAYPIGYEKARDIIEEMVLWDGYTMNNMYYYSSTDKTQSDFYSSVSVLAGHRSYQSIQKDDRKESYKDIHRLFISLNKKSDNTQKCKKTITNFKGRVYCVEVPSGAIVIKHNGFTFITGNCHYFSGMSSQMSKALYKYIKKWNVLNIYLLSATPYMSTPWNIYVLARHLGVDFGYRRFEKQFFHKIQMGGRLIPVIKKGPFVLEELKKLYDPISDSVSIDDCFDVPPQVFITETTELNKAQIKAQKDIKDVESIVYWTKCHQIESGVLKGDEYNDPKDIKCDKDDRIKTHISEHEQIAIVCRYTAQIEKYKEFVPKGTKIFLISGKTKDNGKEAKLATGHKGRCVVFINASCSEGYELPKIPTIIFASMSFAYKDFKQVKGRFLRANALKKNLYIHLTGGKIDLGVYNSIMQKKDFSVQLYKG